MKCRDGFGVLIPLQLCHLTSLHVHNLHQVVRVPHQQVTWETLVLADLDRVVKRVAKMSIVKTITHVFYLSDQLKA